MTRRLLHSNRRKYDHAQFLDDGERSLVALLERRIVDCRAVEATYRMELSRIINKASQRARANGMAPQDSRTVQEKTAASVE